MPAPVLVSRQQSEQAQVADASRVPWNWSGSKSADPYQQQVSGRWWSRSEEELGRMKVAERRNFDHIGRIMETELGDRLDGNDRCDWCRRLDEECWVYSTKGGRQVSKPGDTCARCRVVPRSGGCSLSKRRRRRSCSPPLPGQKVIQPGPPRGPPPGGPESSAASIAP